MQQNFHTFREYMNRVGLRLSASTQDYLEMIYRLSREKGYTRIAELSGALNVAPSAATRMVQKLAELKLVKYKKYGVLELEDAGRLLGESLLERHDTVERFLRVLGVDEKTLLEETEKTEHTLSGGTMRCISVFLDFLDLNPPVAESFREFREKQTRPE